MTEAGWRTGDPSLDELRRVAEELPHVVWITRRDDRTDYFNRRGAEYLGISRDDSYDEAWEAGVHPDDLDRTLAAWAAALAGEREYTCEYRLRAADGTYRWNASRGNPIRGADGRISYWIGTCTDIDDTVRALTVPAQMVTFGWIEVETAPIRIRVDGGAPTTGVGHLYNPGQTDVLNEVELRALQAVRATGVTGLLRVTYYRS